MAARLQLPVLQNWSCHNCSGCCRQHVIEITQQERVRIEQQGWTAADGIPDGAAVIPLGAAKENRWRLAHQPDGACVFLNDNGLCRIHAKFGENAKPLACCVYPYTFHPAGRKLAVSLRFSCPTVVENKGKSVVEQEAELKRIARQAVPSKADRQKPAAIKPGEHVEWEDFHLIIEHLDRIFADDAQVSLKLQRALMLINLIDKATFDRVRGERLEEFLTLVSEGVSAELDSLPAAKPPAALALIQFRLLAGQYARRDTGADLGAGLGKRFQLLSAALRFATGFGKVPVFQEPFLPVAFSTLEESFGGLPEEAEEWLTRYFRVKIQGIHFCGPAFYNKPLVEGFRHLALIFPAICWLARWHAAGDGRIALVSADVMAGITVADHHHGFSDAFAQNSFQKRVDMLVRQQELANLCLWYAR